VIKIFILEQILGMENLLIKATSKTPEVEFLFGGKMKIRGRSIPEDANLFYDHLQSWVFQYCLDPPKSTTVDIELEYMNSASAKSILLLLSELSNVVEQGNNLTVNWYYENGDDDMVERGEYFENILKLRFNYMES
jgi:hypothetical protein